MKALNVAFMTTVALLAQPVAAQAADCAKEPVTVGFLPKLDTDPYFKSAKTGADAAQQEIGGTVIQVAPSQGTAEAQVNFINSLVAKKVGVIAISANDANAVAPALKRAQSQGVRVISYDSDVQAGARSVFVNQAEGQSLAHMMLQSAHDLIGGEGEFAILSSTPTATNQNAWIAQMKSELQSNADYSKMKLVQVAYGEENEQINQQQAIGLVQAFPNLKAIIIPAGLGLPAAARALDEAGLLGKVKLTGLAPASLIAKYIKNGTVQDIWWSVPDLGYLAYYTAQQLAQCKISGKEGETFEAGRLGKYTIGKDGMVLLGPAKIVTTQNLSEFPF